MQSNSPERIFRPIWTRAASPSRRLATVLTWLLDDCLDLHLTGRVGRPRRLPPRFRGRSPRRQLAVELPERVEGVPQQDVSRYLRQAEPLDEDLPQPQSKQ